MCREPAASVQYLMHARYENAPAGIPLIFFWTAPTAKAAALTDFVKKGPPPTARGHTDQGKPQTGAPVMIQQKMLGKVCTLFASAGAASPEIDESLSSAQT